MLPISEPEGMSVMRPPLNDRDLTVQNIDHASKIMGGYLQFNLSVTRAGKPEKVSLILSPKLGAELSQSIQSMLAPKP